VLIRIVSSWKSKEADSFPGTAIQNLSLKTAISSTSLGMISKACLRQISWPPDDLTVVKKQKSLADGPITQLR
jgi:hypothetical protein